MGDFLWSCCDSPESVCLGGVNTSPKSKVKIKIKMYKLIVLVILISKDNSDWYKTSATWIGARKVSRPYEEQRGKRGGIVVFLNEFIIIVCFLYVNVCVNRMKLALKEWGNSWFFKDMLSINYASKGEDV